MNVDQKQPLIDRLNYLWKGELAAVFYFPLAVWLLAFTFDKTPTLPTLTGYGLVAFILLQGVAYWRLKLAAMQDATQIPRAKLRPFRYLQWLNWLLLLSWWGVVWLWLPLDGFQWLVGGGFWTLALLEQINYYYWQLMYDFSADFQALRKTKRLRRPSLWRQLNRR